MSAVVDSRLISHPLADGNPPDWASAWGDDRFGPFVEFEIEPTAGSPVRQRLRWIPPGSFPMGSPETEPGRYEDEGPQHTVQLTRGFWIFDTPCTQALWQAVMGQNPSRFVDPTGARPVEQVSWDDVQTFLGEINAKFDDLHLELPTEAQWEYACRAGTKTALYTGAIEILGLCNAPALDSIAWYGGNSGNGFELDDGSDSSDWPEKQYPHTKAGTRSVGLKQPNAWGLYDMLGNVWEWCADGQREYAAAPQCDPVGPSKHGVPRVFRGGGWSNHARFVRCAYRSQLLAGYRGVNLGFRLVRVQEGS